jgi:hypothetical protein
VQIGLDRRREEQQIAEREKRLDAYERDMIAACNDNCTNARNLRILDEQNRYNKAQMVAQRKEHREKMIQQWERDNAAYNSVIRYVFGCLILMLVTVWTPMPCWAAAATIFGTAVCEAAYLFRLYFPVEEM